MMTLLFASVSLAANPKAMIIFDASGSMWGQIDGVNKVVIARDALKSVVERWNPNVELGLTVYGHRVKGDCNDIQTVIPIGKVNKKQMIDTVYGIMPKGMTPIAKSLRQVANKLRRYEDQTTIILISDGRESCDADPCVTAKLLKAEGINFVAHVVGFNVDAKTDRQLSCVAKATGGEYFSAKNAASLTKAIKTIAKKVEKPKPKPVVIKNTTLELKARYQLSPKGLNVSGMQWEVTQGGKSLYSGSEENPKIPAKVGFIHIKANYARTSEVQKVEGDVTLKAKKNNPVTIQLKSGKVQIDTAEEQGGPKVKSSVHIYPILEGEPSLGDEIAWCVTTKSKACERILPIGDFLIKASYNGMQTQKQFSLTNKETKSIHLYFKQTSRIETSASETDGGKWVDASHAVFIPDEEGQPDSHVCSPNSQKKRVGKCKLPVGKYVVQSRYNEYTKLTPIEIKAGETLKFHVVFGSTGQIETTASETDGGKWIDASHAVYIPDEEGQPDSHVCSPSSYKKRVGKCRLPVGKYVVKSRYNEYMKLTPVEIKAGETLKFHVVFEQFRIETKCIDMGVKVHYEIYANNGRMVHEVDQICSQPLRLTLDAGDYNVEVSLGSDKKEEKFTIGGAVSSLVIDMSAIKKEPSKEELIKADEQTLAPAPTKAQPSHQDSKAENPKKDIKEAAKGLEQLGAIFGQMGKAAEGDNAKELKEAGQFLEALGGLMGGAKKPETATEKKKKIEKKAAQMEQNQEADKSFENAGDDLKMFTD
jgi:Ca-activated chloride channel family protein